MVYWFLVLTITFFLDLITSLGHTNNNKDLERSSFCDNKYVFYNAKKRHLREYLIWKE
jgi:hypothetical protein